jgi:hypothetical protein
MAAKKHTNNFGRRAGNVDAVERARVIAIDAAPAAPGRCARTEPAREGLVRRSAEMRFRRAAAGGEALPLGDRLPIWLAALVATRCQVNRNGEDHAVRWNCFSGRALYTNAGADAELIQPLGVRLQGGQTLAVCWLPGQTTYTVDVYRGPIFCAET